MACESYGYGYGRYRAEQHHEYLEWADGFLNAVGGVKQKRVTERSASVIWICDKAYDRLITEGSFSSALGMAVGCYGEWLLRTSRLQE